MLSVLQHAVRVATRCASCTRTAATPRHATRKQMIGANHASERCLVSEGTACTHDKVQQDPATGSGGVAGRGGESGVGAHRIHRSNRLYICACHQPAQLPSAGPHQRSDHAFCAWACARGDRTEPTRLHARGGEREHVERDRIQSCCERLLPCPIAVADGVAEATQMPHSMQLRTYDMLCACTQGLPAAAASCPCAMAEPVPGQCRASAGPGRCHAGAMPGQCQCRTSAMPVPGQCQCQCRACHSWASDPKMCMAACATVCSSWFAANSVSVRVEPSTLDGTTTLVRSPCRICLPACAMRGGVYHRTIGKVQGCAVGSVRTRCALS